MFAGSLKESWCHERIEIHEVDPLVVENLIEYAYTGKIEVNQENVLLLLKTADLLQFDSVSKMNTISLIICYMYILFVDIYMIVKHIIYRTIMIYDCTYES